MNIHNLKEKIIMEIGLNHYLIISAILFSLGIFGVLSRSNAISVLMGVELILNAANLNYIAFSHYVTDKLSGQIFAIFVIILAASEVAVALAIVLAIYHAQRSINVDTVDNLKG
jgi:NADH-quinone oxidoreductase subunit K